MITYTTPDGKQWEVVEIRKPLEGELIVDARGGVIRADAWHVNAFQPIVRPIVPEWITPTDEDAKQRPMVEVRDKDENTWMPRKLVYVKDVGDEYKYVTVTKDASETSCDWKQCRMRNPEYKAQS